MRTFLAVSPPGEVARGLYSARSRLRECWKGVKWTPSDQYHVTLAFLGERDEVVIADLRTSLAGAFDGIAAFDIAFGGVDCFGRPSSPRVFIETITTGTAGLTDLRTRLRPVLETFGLWEERPYRPHLTLGRARRRGSEGPDSGTLLPPGEDAGGEGGFRASEVRLYQSTLHRDGPEYTVLETWPLKEAS